MRAVIHSDTHLGYRAYAGTDGGRNSRECDVERAWAHVVTNTIAADPDLVLIGGDVFHHPRIGVHAIKAWRDGARRIVEGTAATVVVIPGNHDVGRTTEALTPLIIPDDLPRFQLVSEPRRIHLNIERTGERVAIACLPFQALAEEKAYRVAPDLAADLNVLLVHAAVKGAPGADEIPTFYRGSRALDVGREAERFDLIACGDFHEFRRLHADRLALYPGSSERTSSDIWRERGPKGIVVADTATGELEFIKHETRPVFDYDLGDLPGPPEPTAEGVNFALGQIRDVSKHEGAIVRLVVDGFYRGDRDQVAWDTVRALKARCLHFDLDLRYAERERVALGDRRARKRTLADDAAEFFAPDPPEVRSCAFGYLGLEQGSEREGQGSEPAEPAEAVSA